MTKPIILIGMMGTGKTYIGQKLAERLNVMFYDSDRLIEEKAGCRIAEIFERDGEEKFREVESKTICDLLTASNSVIASGGGAVMNSKTMELIQNQATSIWIQGSIESIMQRVSKNQNRPLLQTENPEERLHQLMKERHALYAKADIVVDNSDSDYNRVIQEIILAIAERA